MKPIDEDTALRLAAISVAAMCNTRESASRERITKDHPLWTAAYSDVCSTVDREMALRERVEHLQLQVGYHVGARMRDGDKRTLPEIVEEAEWATMKVQQP